MNPHSAPGSFDQVSRKRLGLSNRPRHSCLAIAWCLLALLCLVEPATAALTLHPRITAGVGYTDNVFLSPENEEGDFITSVSPGINMSLSGRNGMLTVDYSPTYNNYSRFPEFSYWGHALTLDGWTEITRGTRLEVTDAFLRTEDPLSETDTTVRSSREPYSTNTATVGVVNRFGAEDVIELRYTFYRLENEDPTIEDSAYQMPSMLMTYWFSPNRYALEGEGSYTISEFDISENYEDLEARVRLIKRFGRHLDGYVEYTHSYIDYVNDGEDYRVYSPLIGFIWAERPDTNFGASFGYFYRDNEYSEDDDGIVGSVEMTYNWAAERSVSVRGDVGYDRADFGAENLGFNPYYEVSGTLTHALARQLSGTLAAGYRRNLYIDEDPDREDAVWRAGAGVAFHAQPWMTFNLDYLYLQVNSNIDANDYVENTVTLSVTLTPRQGIRY